MKIRILKTHNLRKVVFCGIAVVAVLGACSSKEKKNFSLTIIASDRLGDTETANLPQGVIDLSMPIEDCETFTLVPQTTLYRLGYDKSTAMTLETKVDAGFAGNRDNPRLIRREIERQLSAKEIGKVFAQPSDPFADLRPALESYLSGIDEHSICIFYVASPMSDGIYDSVRSISSIDEARNLIASELCKGGKESVFVFLDPPIVSIRSNRDPMEADQTLKRLASINLEASKLLDREQRQAALEKVRGQIEGSIDPSDYRFTYELVKNRIYGENHREAFDLLRAAAKIAVEHAQGAYFLDRINDDKNTDLWKLSHGHSQEWESIIEALEHSDTGGQHTHATAKK